MSDTVNFSISGDFPDQKVGADVLQEQIAASAITVALEGINVDIAADDCGCVFESTPTSGDLTILDGLVAAHTRALIEELRTARHLKTLVLPDDYSHQLTVSSTAAGLVITTAIDELNINDETTVTADPSLTKYVLISLIYDESTDAFSIEAFEKTDGEYSDLTADQYLVQQNISEWYVVANGDTLIEVE